MDAWRRPAKRSAGAACVLACLTLGAAGARAATIAVDIESDTVAADSHCSLREAITSANTDMAPFAGAGECAAGLGADVVTLPAGHFTLSRTGAPDDTNVNGDLDVLGAGLTISGDSAANTTIDANRIDRVLDVLAGRTATIERMTVTGGQAATGANGSPVSGPPGMQAIGGSGDPGGDGGGIRNAGTVTITDSTVSNNFSGTGGDGGTGHGGDGTTGATGTNGGYGQGGNGGNGGRGGGIFTSGSLTLTRVIVTANKGGAGGHGSTGTGGQGGGGISGNGGSAHNGRGGRGGDGGDGGGVAAGTGATLTIDQSTINSNTAGGGGSDGLGQGGAGGVTAGNGSIGGSGGIGDGGLFTAGTGGRGGGVYSVDPITVARSLVTGNRGGMGGHGGNGTGGLGGHGIDTGGNSATGGHGGSGAGHDGGDGGAGGGIYAKGEFVNVTITANASGHAGDGGNGTGGNGGNSTGGPMGSTGGSATAGDGGDGGFVGGIEADSSTFRHATITANDVGSGGVAGSRVVGNGGSPGGNAGFAINGQAGSQGFVGGFYGSTSPTFANTVVAGNAIKNCAGGEVDGGHNFTFPDASCPGTVADPQLGPLADNGGPSMTQALLPGSPAIDAAPADANCPGTDQRGIVRPQGPACDSGAYEVALPVPPTPTTPPGEGGPTPGPSGTTAPPRDTQSPALSAVSIKPSTFAVDSRGKRETPVTAKVPKGTTFRFRLSENARVVVAIERPQPGRRVKRRCVKPTRSNLRKAKCTRFVVVGRFATAARVGANSKKFTGLIGRRALKPGRYRATLIAKDAAGNPSAPKRINFRVVRS